MPEYDPLENPELVSGLSGDYFAKTFDAQDKKRLKEKEKRINDAKQRELLKQKKAATEELKTKKRKANTVNPLQKIGEALAPVGDAIQAPFDFIADKADDFSEVILGKQENERRKQRAAEVRQGIRDPFDRTPMTPEKAKQNLAEGKKLQKDLEAPIDLLRVPIKGAVAGIEGVLDIGTQAVMDATINLGKSDDEYIRAAWDFGVTPKTQLGKFASQIMSFAVVTRQAGRMLKLKPNVSEAKGWAEKGKRLITDGLIPGAIADFILTDPEEGNLSSAIQKLFPEEVQNSAWFALAADPNDKPWVNRFRALFEGGPLNAFGNVLASFIPARKVAQEVLKNNGSKEEALARGIDTFIKETDAAAKADISEIEAERIRWTEANEAEMNSLLNKEANINEQIARLDPEADADELVRLDADLENIQFRKADLESRYYEATDSDMRYEYWQSQATIRAANPTDAVIDQTTRDLADDGTGQISKAARSNHVLTDAQVRIMNLDDGQVAVIDRFKKEINFKQVSRKVNMTLDALKQQAEVVYGRLADVFKSYDDVLSEEDYIKALADAGGTLDYGSRATFANPEGAIAVKTLIDELSDTIYDIAYGAEQLDYSGIGGFNNYDRLIDRFVALLGIYKDSANYHGAGLNSFKVRLKSLFSSEEQVMRQMEEADELTYKDIKSWAEKIKSAARRGDPAAQDELRALTRAMVLAGGDPANTVSFFKAVWNTNRKAAEHIFINNILSGFKTFVRNSSGILRTVVDPFYIVVGAKTPEERAAGIAGLNAIAGSLGDAWRVAKITWNTQIPATSTPQSVVERAEMDAAVQMMEQIANTDMEKIGAGYLKWIVSFSRALNLPGRLMMTTDDFVRTIVARQRIAELAMYDAVKEAPDLTDRGELVLKYMKKYSQYMDPQTGKIKDKGLQVYTDIAVFQNDPGQAVNSLSNFISHIPFGRYIVPFIRTPANMLGYQLEHIPLVAKFSERYKEAVNRGDALMVAELDGRMAVGAWMAASGVLLGLVNAATGNLPIDPKERKRWKDLKIQPRSFKFGNIYISYNAIEPLNNILAAAVDISQIAALAVSEDNPGLQELASKFSGQLGLALAASFTEKSYFQNLEVLSTFFDIQKLSPEVAQRTIAGYVFNQAMPYSSQWRAWANTFDPYQREFDNEWQRVFAGNMLGLRNLMPPVIDETTGKPMKNPNYMLNAHVPFEISVDDQDPVHKMLERVRYTRKDIKTHKGVELTKEQREFVRRQTYEAGLRRDLMSLMKQEWFDKDIKAYRGRSFDPNAPKNLRPRFYNSVDEVFDKAHETALARLEQSDRNFKAELQKTYIKSAQFKAGRYSGETSQQAPSSDPAILNELLKYSRQ